MTDPDDRIPTASHDSASSTSSIGKARADEGTSTPRVVVETWLYKVIRDGTMTVLPISRTGLENLIRKGSILPDTLVRPEEDPNRPQFLRLADWPEFADFFSVNVSAASNSIETVSLTTELKPTNCEPAPPIAPKPTAASLSRSRSRFREMAMWFSLVGLVGGFNLWYYLAVIDPPFHAPPASERGFGVREWTSPQGESFKYGVFIPHYYENHRYLWGLWNRPRRPPVLVFLHGYLDFDAEGVRAVKTSFGSEIWEKKRRFPFVVVFPQMSKPNSWSVRGPGFPMTMGLLEYLERELDTDRSRVYLTGISSGGDGCLEFAASAPGRFAAIAPTAAGSHLAGRYSTIEATAMELAKLRLPIWFSYNGGDIAQVSGYFNPSYTTALTDAGAPPKTTVYPLTGHGSWEPFHRSPEFYTWLLSHTTDTLRLPDPIATTDNTQSRHK